MGLWGLAACGGPREPEGAPDSGDGAPAAQRGPALDRPPLPDGAAPEPPVDCGPACAALHTDADRARCYGCRCKAAMDGWLPGPDELQCDQGAPIEVFTADAVGRLSPLDGAAPACANPTLLYGTCASGGTLGQLRRGDVHVKWICRRNEAAAHPGDP